MIVGLFWTFFKIGLFTFGGGYAMIAQIREAIVEKKGWIDEEELLHIITVAESTPGPIAINLATYVGFRRRGFWGALMATVGMILPSMVILFAISLVLDGFMANPYVAYAFEGIQAAVAFLILKAGADMLKKMKKTPLSVGVFAVVLAGMLAAELFAVSLSTVLLILCGGLLGICCYGILARKGEEK